LDSKTLLQIPDICMYLMLILNIIVSMLYIDIPMIGTFSENNIAYTLSSTIHYKDCIATYIYWHNEAPWSLYSEIHIVANII